jgi:hypothetical protein
MFAGHADQIGLLVTHIDDEGFVYTNTIGGWDPQQLIGQRMTIYTAGGPVPAVIARKPIHLLDQEERKQVVKTKEMWLDIGAKKKDEAAEVVRIAIKRCAMDMPIRPAWMTRRGCGSASKRCGGPSRARWTCRSMPCRPCRKKSASAGRPRAPTA